MKDYWVFAQELKQLTDAALHDMLRTETDQYRTKLIHQELDDRAEN